MPASGISFQYITKSLSVYAFWASGDSFVKIERSILKIQQLSHKLQFYYVVNFRAFWISLATKHDIPNFWHGNSNSKSQGLGEEINKIRCEYIKREIQSRYTAGTASCQMTGNENSREITLGSHSQCQGAGVPPTQSESVLFIYFIVMQILHIPRYTVKYAKQQTNGIDTWRENVRLLSFNDVIVLPIWKEISFVFSNHFEIWDKNLISKGNMRL